jgi:hypothetical protein
MKNHFSKMRNEGGNVNHYVLSVEIEQKASIMHYHEHKYPFFRITMALPKHVPIARGNFNILSLHLQISSHFQTFFYFLLKYISTFPDLFE